MASPKVCVIIPTLRNADELEIALEGLSNQTWDGPLEIAIVGPTGDPGEVVANAKKATVMPTMTDLLTQDAPQ